MAPQLFCRSEASFILPKGCSSNSGERQRERDDFGGVEEMQGMSGRVQPNEACLHVPAVEKLVKAKGTRVA